MYQGRRGFRAKSLESVSSYHVFIAGILTPVVSIDHSDHSYISEEDEKFIFQQRLEYQSCVLEELSGLTENGF